MVFSDLISVKSNLSILDIVLTAIYLRGKSASSAEIQYDLQSNGLNQAGTWPISRVLFNSPSLVCGGASEWRLSEEGIKEARRANRRLHNAIKKSRQDIASEQYREGVGA